MRAQAAVATVACVALLLAGVGRAQTWHRAIEVFQDDPAMFYNGVGWQTLSAISTPAYEITNHYFEGGIEAVRVTINGISREYTIRIEDRGVKTLRDLAYVDPTSSTVGNSDDTDTTSPWNLLRDGHEIYNCGEFSFNRLSPFGGIRIGFLTDNNIPCQDPGSAEGVGVWSRGTANTELASGRAQWESEPERFHAALVEVRFPEPACALPPSEWLQTEFSPILDIAGTGFTTGTVDLFRFSFDYHRKYFDEWFSTGADASLQAVAVTENEPVDTTLGPCYDNIHLDIAWGDLVPFCFRDDSDPVFVEYTCKVIAEGKEDLDPIRGQGLTRVVHNEIPVIVQFPKQVSASVADLSAFQPPNVLAAIVRQEVNVDVSNLNVVATTRLFSSIQYPFRLVNPSWDLSPPPGATTTPSGISPGSAPFMVSDCTPYPDAGDSPGQPGDENACNQVWELDLDVAFGAGAGSVCELDGDYYFYWQAECLPTFPSDCPLVQDDQGVLEDKFAIKFTLDSEYFCPQVVDEVDVAASMSVYKDLQHAVSATNFILGQTTYAVVDVTSNKATVVGAQLDDLSYNRGAGDVDVVVDGVAASLPANDELQALVWYDSGATVPGGAVVPQNQVWFQFLVSNPPFLPPVDGSEDFSLTATLNVQFKDASVALLLQAGSSRQVGAQMDSSVRANEDDSTAGAAQARAVAAVVAAAFVGAPLGLAA